MDRDSRLYREWRRLRRKYLIRYRYEERMWRAINREDKKWFTKPRNNQLMVGWYSLNDQLAHMMIPAMDKLIDNLHGYPPGILDDDYSGGPASVFLLSEDAEDNPAARAWKNVLIQIRDGFQAHVDLEETWKLKLSREERKKHEDDLIERRNWGLILFARWYAHLWD